MKTSVALFFFFVWFDLRPCFGDDAHNEFKACGVHYNCGELVNITYPFWGNERPGYCGRREFGLKCKENRTTTMEIDFLEYNVLNISQSDSRMTIARSDLFDNYCPKDPIQTGTLDYQLFMYSLNDRNISVWYNCPPQQEIPSDFRFSCGAEGRANYAFDPTATNLSRIITGCTMNIEVTITIQGLEEGGKNGTKLLERALRQGFDVEYENWYTIACDACKVGGGNCGGNTTYQFYCICGDGDAHPYVCGTVPANQNLNKTFPSLCASCAYSHGPPPVPTCSFKAHSPSYPHSKANICPS